MNEEAVSFVSTGVKIRALLRTPQRAKGPLRAIVHGPGWLHTKESSRYRAYHRAFTDAGFAVLIIDYRGMGESEGPRNEIRPTSQVLDLVDAVSYLAARDDIDSGAIGAFGSGGTGGGNAIMLAAADIRVRCVVSQVPIADGAQWLRAMRRAHEWSDYLDRLEADRRVRVLGGRGELVDPSTEIMLMTPTMKLRREQKVAATEDIRVSLRTADDLLTYRPIDVVHRVRNLLVVAVEDDDVTPADHAAGLFEKARSPKKLIMQRGVSHYESYESNADLVIPQMVEWFESKLANERQAVREFH